MRRAILPRPVLAGAVVLAAWRARRIGEELPLVRSLRPLATALIALVALVLALASAALGYWVFRRLAPHFEDFL